MQEYAMTEYSQNAQPHFNLLRILGGWGNVKFVNPRFGPHLVHASLTLLFLWSLTVDSGPGLFMLRSMLAGTATAAVVGLAASFVGASIWGTAGLPFIIGSSLGFVLGSTRWYVAASQEALLQLDKYPSILRLHLVSNFPWKPELGRLGVEWYTARRFSSNWQMKSMLIAAWLTAQPALDEIRNRRETELVEAYSRQRILERVSSSEREDEDNGEES